MCIFSCVCVCVRETQYVAVPVPSRRRHPPPVGSLRHPDGQGEGARPREGPRAAQVPATQRILRHKVHTHTHTHTHTPHHPHTHTDKLTQLFITEDLSIISIMKSSTENNWKGFFHSLDHAIIYDMEI